MTYAIVSNGFADGPAQALLVNGVILALLDSFFGPDSSKDSRG